MRRRYMGIKSYTTFDINNYFTIEALDDDLYVVFTKDVEFGIDGIGWQKLLANTNSPTINKGQTISFRASIIPVNFEGIGQFVINKSCNLSGNIMSLLWKGTIASFSFYYLFKDCTTIKSADRLVLPATTLADQCYRSMFHNCTSLTTAPVLPATTLADQCYRSMFHNCTSLTTAPVLPATTLADYCYGYMFCECTSLVNAPALPATTLADNCYNAMFNGCTSLTTAPELPATTLAYHCYDFMFFKCIKLNYIKMLATDISASGCLNSWVRNVSSTGTFVKNTAMTSLPTATSSNTYTGIPSGWTVVNDVGSNKIVNNIYQSFVEEGPDIAFIITSEYPVTSVIRIYNSFGELVTGINIGNTQSAKYYSQIDITSTYIRPTEDDTYIYNLVKD